MYHEPEYPPPIHRVFARRPRRSTMRWTHGGTDQLTSHTASMGAASKHLLMRLVLENATKKAKKEQRRETAHQGLVEGRVRRWRRVGRRTPLSSGSRAFSVGRGRTICASAALSLGGAGSASWWTPKAYRRFKSPKNRHAQELRCPCLLPSSEPLVHDSKKALRICGLSGVKISNEHACGGRI